MDCLKSLFSPIKCLFRPSLKEKIGLAVQSQANNQTRATQEPTPAARIELPQAGPEFPVPQCSESSEHKQETTIPLPNLSVEASLNHSGLNEGHASSLSPDDVMSRRSLSNHNSKGSEADKELKELLKKARVESPSDCHEFFVPNCSQEQLITIEIVSRIIVAAHPSIPPEELRILAQKTCQSSRHLFAILAYLKKGADIYHLHAEDITDEDLPFERRHDAQISRRFELQRRTEKGKTGKLIRTFENWSDDDLERFHRCQWWMTAPIFEDGRHYELADNTVLPFTPLRDAEAQTPKTGGYSEVSSAHIHPSHHRFSGLRCSLLEKGGMLVAIKKLNSPDEKVFRKEQDILEKLGSKQPQLHLIKLLATYKHKHKYHLVFPRADANLRQYWDTNPKPVFDRTTVLWSLKQMAGIAQALRVVHNFRVSIPLNIEGAGGVRVQKGVQLSVKKGEELYGRHGDIKPENVLWFKYLDGIEDQNGVLQLADFGLGGSTVAIHDRRSLRAPFLVPRPTSLRSVDFICRYLEHTTYGVSHAFT